MILAAEAMLTRCVLAEGERDFSRSAVRVCAVRVRVLGSEEGGEAISFESAAAAATAAAAAVIVVE